jgi:hypothetical protein
VIHSGNIGSQTVANADVAATAASAAYSVWTVNSDITNDTTSSGVHYMTFVSAASGHLPIKVNNAGLLYVPSTGQLTVNGRSTSTVPFVVNAYTGTTANLQQWYINSASKAYLDYLGNWNGLDFIASSDARLKENILTIPNALGRVCQMRGVNYTRKDDPKKSLHMGVIAQEMEGIAPEVVSTDEKGMKSVSYQSLVGILIEAVKDQQKQIDELREALSNQGQRY